MSTITMTGVQPGFPRYVVDGRTVTYTSPAGCQLRRSADMEVWDDVATPSPFVHTGDPAHYRVDCDVYEGEPKVVTFTITGPQA